LSANAPANPSSHHLNECTSARIPAASGMTQSGTITGMCRLNLWEKHSCSHFVASFVAIDP
jgi:hypothetical protein